MGSVYGLHIANHGALCCGVKHIRNFGNSPDQLHSALESAYKKHPVQGKVTSDCNHDDKWGNEVKSVDRFYLDEAPQETAEKRLERYLAYIAKWRPSHLVEITLCESDSGFGQEKWFPVVEKLGFNMVTRFKNSNSDNMVRVYHLVIVGGKVVK